MKIFLIPLFTLLAAGMPCLAALGDTVASVAADQQKFQLRRQITRLQNYTVHAMTQDNGTTINEYVAPSGTVFAVTWRAPQIPDLSQLLGSYFPTFQSQILAQSRVKARRGGAMVHSGNLVVESSGHPRDYRGRAYLSDQLPAGVTEAMIQ